MINYGLENSHWIAYKSAETILDSWHLMDKYLTKGVNMCPTDAVLSCSKV